MDDQVRLETWLAADGKVGECPEWYALLWLASKLQIPPWEIDAANPLHAEWIAHAKAGALAERRAEERQRQRERSRYRSIAP